VVALAAADGAEGEAVARLAGVPVGLVLALGAEARDGLDLLQQLPPTVLERDGAFWVGGEAAKDGGAAEENVKFPGNFRVLPWDAGGVVCVWDEVDADHFRGDVGAQARDQQAAWPGLALVEGQRQGVPWDADGEPMEGEREEVLAFPDGVSGVLLEEGVVVWDEGLLALQFPHVL
jgi:hypothetical protein